MIVNILSYALIYIVAGVVKIENCYKLCKEIIYYIKYRTDNELIYQLE